MHESFCKIQIRKVHRNRMKQLFSTVPLYHIFDKVIADIDQNESQDYEKKDNRKIQQFKISFIYIFFLHTLLVLF